MPTYLSPGVYIEEVPSGPQPIAAAPTSVVAVLGRTRRGPVKDPTRITGWSDFERVFGGNAGDGFTAEAVYGFFENGGPAAWVVRVDPSVAGTWTVKEAGGADSFTVTASSPGAWSADLRLAVAPDTSGGSGTPYRATITADVTLAGVAIAVAVDSVVGVAVGDAVLFLRDNDAAATTEATVTAVAPGSLTVLKTGGGNVSLAKGQVVTAHVAASAPTIKLAAGSGIRVGDVLLAQAGDGARTAWHVTGVASQGSGLVVTVAPQASAVVGAQFTERIARFAGNLATSTGPTVALGAITWAEDAALAPTAALMTTSLHAWAADGMEGTWNSGDTAIRFPAAPPAGPITVEARLRVNRYTDAAVLATPDEAALMARYSFVPEGTALRLKVQGAATTATVTRSATGFTVTAGTLAATFESAEFLLPDDASKGVLVRCARPPATGDRVRFSATRVLTVTAVQSLGGSLYLLGFTATDALDTITDAQFELRSFVTTTFAPLRFSLAVSGSGGSETFTGLALDPAHPQYFAKDGVINEASSLITVAPRAAGAGAPSLTTTPAFAVAGTVGIDVAPTTADVKKALTALEAETEPAMVICPDILTFTDPLLQYDLADAVVRHCESFRRFAILDAPDDGDEEVLAWRNTAVSSTYASVFAPHLKIVNLDTTSPDRFRTVPASGFVAGVIARTDRERGVHKAPGNERVSGIVGLSQNYTQRRQDLLNPSGVNLIRAFPGRGTRVWGARNATDDVTWRYINVRRLFNFVETSVDRGTQWVVFEPNTATTWLRIKASLEGFLDQLWRSGALAGATAEQAYRVRVGLGQTMTETDIDLGLVITEVAIAPAKPAEFVVFRFSHKRLSE